MNNNYNNRGRGGFGGSGSCGRSGKKPYGSSGVSQKEFLDVLKAKALPSDYLQAAEDAMIKIQRESDQITRTKLRNLYSLTMCIYDRELRRSEAQLLPEDQSKLTMMEMRVLYEYGRDDAVKVFVEKTQILGYLKGVKDSRQAYLNFAHYMEALVAYHRFLGIGGNK